MSRIENTVPAAHAYQFPSGHLGHLSTEQQEGFVKFKQLCQDRGAYFPGTAGKNGGRPSQDDATILRFLRARRFQLDPAFEQFNGTEKWRKENKILELYENIDVQAYEDTRRLYPQWVGRRDKRGMPVYLFQVGNLTSKNVQAYEQAKGMMGFDTTGLTASPKLLRLFALYENLCRFVNPWSTSVEERPHNTTPITQGCNIIDITGVGLKQFWDLKSHLQDSSQLATAHYPETLDRIFIIGAPSWFPTIWNWVKGFFDPIVVSKMFVIPPSEVLKTLSQHIDTENIPKQYGGGLDYAFGDMPVLDPMMLNGAKWNESAGTNGEGGGSVNGEAKVVRKLPIGPIRWEEGESGQMRAVAVGSVNGKKRSEVVFELEKMYGEVFYPQHRPDPSPNATGTGTPITAAQSNGTNGNDANANGSGSGTPTAPPPVAPTVPGPAASA